MPENSLSAAIASNLAQQEPEKPKPKRTPAAPKTQAKGRARKPRTGETVLVGGHFPPSVLKQLKLIAVEEETTNQALLAEALNLLFVKKGRAKIDKL